MDPKLCLALLENFPTPLLVHDASGVVWHNTACTPPFRKVIDAHTPSQQLPSLQLGDKTFVAFEIPLPQMSQRAFGFRDVTDFNRSQAKTEFLSNMSHELRTPTNTILVGLELLMVKPEAQPVRPRLEVIHRSTKDLVNMLDDLLDTSAIEERRITIHPRPCNIYAMAYNAVFSYPSPKVHLELDFDPACSRVMITDEKRLRQILTNLLSNAVKYTPRGYVRLRVWFHDKAVHFEVTDTGLGFDSKNPQTVKTMFQRFSRLNTHAAQAPGKGIGLWITNQLVKLMDGTISVRSEPGKGSTFTVCLSMLPVDGIDTPLNTTPKYNTLPKFKWHVLVVEDLQPNQLVVAELLQLFQCTMEVAENGAIAVEMFQKQKYDLIIMDCHMPVMDGFEATRQIRNCEFHQKPPPQKTPIVGCTASVTFGPSTCFEAGMNFFLAKPITIQTCRETFDAVHKFRSDGSKLRNVL